MPAPRTRDFSVFPAWFVTEPRSEYAKIRPLEGVVAAGRSVDVQRQGDTAWLAARVVDKPADRDSFGFMVWLQLE